MKYLWAEWDSVKRRLASEREKLILLDFDGTLLPIAETPSSVFLSPETRTTLRSLVRTPKRRLVIVSGRPLGELYGFLRLRNVLYVANHGLEIKGRGLSLPPAAKKARKLKGLIQRLTRKFESAFGGCYDGILIEDKNFTLSLHYRNLPKDQKLYFEALVNFLKDKYRHYPIVWTRGKKVWEIRPSVFWGKGEAAVHLTKKFPNALPVAIGDDKADEDMFKALGGKGLTIRVGYLKHSAAEYYLQSPYDVRVFLGKLCR